MKPTALRNPDPGVVSPQLKQALVEYYEKQLQRYGPTARGMDWKDEASQRLRFEVLCGVCDLNGKSVHEIGAGVGHLHDFMQERGIAACYSGSDLSAEMVDAARRLHPGISFERTDILLDESPATHDVVLCSGLFHVKLDHSKREWSAFLRQTLRRMYEMSHSAIAFNLMSEQVDFRAPQLFYADASEVLEFCREELSPFVVLRDDYPLYEFTIYVYRNRPVL